MANTKITTNVIADDAITTAKIADDIALGGNPTTTTQSAGNNTTRIATTAFVTTAVSGASATLTGIDDQSSSNDDQITITDTAVIINEDSDDVDFRVEGNGNANLLNVNAAKDYVSIGSASDFSAGASVLHLHQPDATSNAYLHITQEDGGATASDGMSIGVLDGGANAVVRLRENGYLSTYTNNTERNRIGNTGKQSWSAGGVGDVTTQSRDFTFYTEGGSNGVAINSNDHRIVFMGGAASSGAGMDTGYFQLENAGSANVFLNANGTSNIGGGAVNMSSQPMFGVARNAGYLTDDQVWVCDTVDTNVGSHYATANGKFTAPVAGTYFFTGSVMTHDSSSSTTQVSWSFRKNNSEVKEFRQHKIGSVHCRIDGSMIITLAENDYVTLFVNDSNTSSGWAGSQHPQNHFGGFLIG